jgi:acarbose 7IV-phosphotransferase
MMISSLYYNAPAVKKYQNKTKQFVSGLINLEVTLRVDGFPIEYVPAKYPFFGVNSTVSGVGYNVAKALVTLGSSVSFASIIGQDQAARLVRETLAEEGLSGEFVIGAIPQTAHSVIIFDKSGRRQINVDLKDVQEQVYPQALFERAIDGCSLAALCNINFSRPFLRQCRDAGRLVATDVHAISRLDDDYNRDFMRHADILFMSHELLPCVPEEWAIAVLGHYGNAIVVIGLGAEGALFAVKDDGIMKRIPTVYTRPVVNTIGAGDALFSAFVHFYAASKDPYTAIEKAMIFASYKVGATGAADGFLDEARLNMLYGQSR